MATKRTRVDDTDKNPPQKKRITVFNAEKHGEKWPCLAPGRKGEGFVFCNICACDFSIKSGGSFDCSRHIENAKHAKNVALKEEPDSSSKITSFFEGQKKATVTSTEVETIKAETMLVDLVVELNLPMASLDKLNKYIKTTFKDSTIAKNFQCARSKGTAIAKEIAATRSLELAHRMKTSCFTISTDGSNDLVDIHTTM
jgi:hypothetical protein